MTLGPFRIKKPREELLQRLRRRKEELRVEQQRVHSQMHEDVRTIMGSKATLLLEELAKEVGYKDEDLASELREGFHIIGILPDCREFPHEQVDPSMEVEGLRTVSKWAQHAVVGQLRNNQKLSSHIMEKMHK